MHNLSSKFGLAELNHNFALDKKKKNASVSKQHKAYFTHF
jgi:hypothetical protein